MLCHNQQLLHDFLQTNPTTEDWAEKWYPNIVNHPRHEGWAVLAELLWTTGFTVILLTARPERKREATVEWCQMHGITYDRLFMRLDHHEHHNTKRLQMADIMTDHEVELAIDDDRIHVEIYEELGIPVIHAYNGLQSS